MSARHPPLLSALGSAFLLMMGPSLLEAQHAITDSDLKLRNVRASGQPVLPIFEGWYPRADGTYDLCFGYFNLNREESLDIPLGPDNFIEPSGLDGVQPTHFIDDAARLTCIFTVNVPADIGSERVWWNLRIDEQVYRVPGHVTSRTYMVDDLASSFPAMLHGAEDQRSDDFLELRSQAAPGVAPVVRFLDPNGPAGRGKSGVTGGPVTASVGSPRTLTISVSGPDGGGLPNDGSVRWGKFRGPPGEVTFSPDASRYAAGAGETRSTEVTFEQPGDYLLFVQVLQGSFGNQCCWTNGYVHVTVTP